MVLQIDSSSGHNYFLNNIIHGIKGVAFSVNKSDVIYSGTDIDSYNVFDNNIIRCGDYGIYWSGTSTSGTEKANKFTRNLIDSFCSGNRFYYQNQFIFSDNIIKSNNNTGTALYISYIFNRSFITGNKLYTGGDANGLYISYCDGIKDSIYIANNMISNKSKSSFPVYAYSSNKLNIYFNSFLYTGTSSSGYSAIISNIISSNPQNRFYNNICHNSSGGYVISSYYGITTSDYNDYYTSGTKIGYWNATVCNTLSDWKSTSGQDKNSITIDPSFYSSADLHVKKLLLRKAKYLATVTKDIDGDNRSKTTPNIGADEFVPLSNDAGVYSIDSPVQGFCAGKKAVYATLFNNGSNAITSVTVKWMVNGTSQTPYVYSGNIVSGGTVKVKLDTFNFTSSKTVILKVFTSSPNGTTDSDNSNDTLNTSLYFISKGSFTIGGISPDFNTFSNAINYLNKQGVCGAVTFNIRDGYYNEQIEIGSIKGASASNTITFQSQSKDSTKVTLDWKNTGAPFTKNYTLHMKGATYTTFKHITISRTKSATNFDYMRVVQIDSGCGYNIFLNNRLYCTILSSTGNYSEVILASNGIDSYNVFDNNIILGGGNSIRWAGSSSSSTERSNKFTHNLIDSSYFGSIFFYQDELVFSENVVKNIVNGSGLYLYYIFNKSIISKNKIYVTGNNNGLGFFYCNGLKDSICVFNNMISSKDSNLYPISFYYSSNMNIYFNSLLNAGINNVTTCAEFFYKSSATPNTRFYNNICQNNGKGNAIESYYGLTSSDYNNLYTSGTEFGYWNGTKCITFSDWKTTSGQDKNSLSIHLFYPSRNDLHTKNISLRKGKYILTVPKDIDGEARDTSSPYIGADEYFPSKVDASVDSIFYLQYGTTCGDSNTTITVRVVNNGTSSLSNIPIKMLVNSKLIATDTLMGSLAAYTDSLFTFKTKINTFASGTLDIALLTDVTGDGDQSNDTIKRTYKFITPSTISFTKGVFNCSPGKYKLVATATSSADTIYWFNSGLTYVATGDTLKTPFLSSPTVYYAQAGAKRYNPGLKNYKSTGGFYSTTTYNYGTVFDAIKNFYLESVNVYYTGSGQITVNLIDKSGKLIAYKTISVTKTSSFKSITIPLNFYILADTGYIIHTYGSTVSTMYFSTGASYPYYAGNLMKITGSNYATGSTNYFYTYNWVVTNTNRNCPSSMRMVKADVAGLKASFYYKANCSNNSVTLYDTSVLGGSQYASRKWDFGDGGKDTAKNPLHSYSGSGPFKVTLIITTKAGCLDSISYNISFGKAPVPSFTDSSSCLKNPVFFKDSSVINGISATYLWSFGDGKTDTLQNPSHTYASSGSQTVSLTITNNQGCSAVKSKMIYVDANPNASFIKTAHSVNTYTFTPADTGYSSYFWDFGDSTSSTSVSSTHSYTTLGKFTVKLKVDNGKGCSDSSNVSISVITGLISIIENNFTASIFPNPFSESTNIHYAITQRNHVKIYITDVLGRTVCTLTDANQSAGEYSLDLPCFENVASLGMAVGGVYFVHFIVGDRRVVERVVMAR
ncbi:MAG: PKD domain-containing protein [Bacteroidetes bacterium]|nr:PKD domain-containing protein [Bacteroidota bacterium]